MKNKARGGVLKDKSPSALFIFFNVLYSVFIQTRGGALIIDI